MIQNLKQIVIDNIDTYIEKDYNELNGVFKKEGHAGLSIREKQIHSKTFYKAAFKILKLFLEKL